MTLRDGREFALRPGMSFAVGDDDENPHLVRSGPGAKVFVVDRGRVMRANAGGRDGLAPKIGLFPLTNIVVANMIGAGIFTTSGLLMRDLGDPLVMLGLWAVGGLIALCGALAYGELGAAIPRAGGEYAFLSELYHPLLGFLSGWASFFVGFSAPIAASAIGFSEYFMRAFPGLPRRGSGLRPEGPGLSRHPPVHGRSMRGGSSSDRGSRTS